MKAKIFLQIALFLLADFTFGQKLNDKRASKQMHRANKELNNSSIKSFTAQNVGNTIYINWLSKDSIENCFYILERSSDGKNYSTVSIKRSFISPNGIMLSYSVCDTAYATCSKLVYRLKLVSVHKMNAIIDDNKLLVFVSNDISRHDKKFPYDIIDVKKVLCPFIYPQLQNQLITQKK